SKFNKRTACCDTLLSYQISLSNPVDFGIIISITFRIVFCRITVQRYRTLNAVFGYALALRGGGSGA
ncbi:hypothetical protein T11_6271, partial [Trichinella zimbabwensis]